MDAITSITISNNRQNPVKSWQLHANDPIQRKLEDCFKQMGIPYQRQDRAFAKITAQEWEDLEFKETKAIELMKLARTYLAVEGDLSKLTHIQDVFEDDETYKELFGEHRLRADFRLVILCYKAHFHINAIAREIAEKGPTLYSFVHRTREIIGGLVCQGLLNDGELEDIADTYGRDMIQRHAFNEKLRTIASTRVRFLLKHLLDSADYADKVLEGNYSFMKTNPAFSAAMARARQQWGWERKLLRG